MKNSKDINRKMQMPVGFSKVNLSIVTLKDAQKNFDNLIPIDNLTEQQRINLTLANWQHGCWEDSYFNSKLITLKQAVEEVNKKTEIGIELVRICMLGLEYMYDNINPEKTKLKSEAIAKVISPQGVETTVQAANFNVLIYNQTDNDVQVYKQSTSGMAYVCTVPHDNSRPEGSPIDFVGQYFEARVYSGVNYTIASGYCAYPGNTDWEIFSFDPGSLLPSCWIKQLPGLLNIYNNLDTYVEIRQVLYSGSTSVLAILQPHTGCACGARYAGFSFIATQGETIVDEFVIDNNESTTWNIDPVCQPQSTVNFTGTEKLTCTQTFNLSGNFTIMCTISAGQLTANNYGTIWGLIDSSSENNLITLDTYGNPIGMMLTVGTDTISIPWTFNSNQFYQVCVINNNSTISVVIDGVTVASKAMGSLPALQNCNLFLGIDTMWSSYLGQMRNFGLWNRILNNQELIQSQVPIAGTLLNNLMGFWYLNNSLADTTSNSGLLLKSSFPARDPVQINFASSFTETFIPGTNGYVFYQATNPQNDTITQQSISIKKTISVDAGIAYLYAGFEDSDNVYYSFPQGAVLQITDPNGNTYNQTIIPESAQDTKYIQMSIDNLSLYHLCIKNPAAGNWIIQITGPTNVSFRFQFQTIPTSAVYSTIQQALQPVFGDQWSDIAVIGLTNVLNGKPALGKETRLGVFGLDDFLVGMVVILVSILIGEGLQMTDSIQSSGHHKESTNNDTKNAFVPPPSNIKKMLLVDANGSEAATIQMYNYRLKKLYPVVQSGLFRNTNKSLVGTDDTQANLAVELKEPNLIYVSASGHGNYNRLEGYNQVANLTSDQVNASPDLAKDKIFHFLACRTGGGNPAKSGDVGLGQTLVNNGATAFLGYNVEYETSDTIDVVLRGDLAIDNALLEGNSVEVAKNRAIQTYTQVINQATYGENPNPTIAGYAKNNMDGLVAFGDMSAKIC